MKVYNPVSKVYNPVSGSQFLTVVRDHCEWVYMAEILLDKFGAIVWKNTHFEGWTIYFVRFLSQK